MLYAEGFIIQTLEHDFLAGGLLQGPVGNKISYSGVAKPDSRPTMRVAWADPETL